MAYHDQLLFLRVENAVGGSRQELRISEQLHDQLDWVESGPDAVDVRPDGPTAGNRVLYSIVGGVTASLHSQQDLVGQPLRQHGTPGAVSHTALPQFVDDLSCQVS